MLRIRSALPQGFLDCTSRELPTVLDGPTLIQLGDSLQQPLFVSILLHGNESTGLLAMQRLLRDCNAQPLPRPLWLLVGNVEAAGAGRRRLPGQADYNRVWLAGDGPEHHMARQVLARVRPARPVACIDIHNNSGANPLYAVVSQRAPQHLALAGCFARTVVYAMHPDSTCSAAFSGICPSVALEAGRPGDPRGIEAVIQCLRRALESPAPELPPDIDLIRSVAVVRVAPSCRCGAMGEDVDIELVPDIERYNFTEIPAGTKLARLRAGGSECIDLQAFDSRADGDWLRVIDGDLVAVRPWMPAMLTSDPESIKWDCLCYVMEKL